jgi:predicted nucleotidyltransferase component of viral defense system
MHDAIRTMLAGYPINTQEDTINALREILQSIALLGLWRSKFFERAAFYGGSALRLLYGMDRYSEDLDFSLLQPDPSFTLNRYGDALKREISSFGFQVEFETRRKTEQGAIESAFLKTSTYRQLITIEVKEDFLKNMHPQKTLKIKLEVDLDPPGGFETEPQYILQPIPFSVRIYRMPDLFAGKLHAILFRRWKKRIKGRDWYDLVWYTSHHPEVNLHHLASRMRQTGDYPSDQVLTIEELRLRLRQAIESIDIESAKRDVAPFLRNPKALDVWSTEFFMQIIARIKPM